jgi:hypothetical protein
MKFTIKDLDDIWRSEKELCTKEKLRNYVNDIETLSYFEMNDTVEFMVNNKKEEMEFVNKLKDLNNKYFRKETNVVPIYATNKSSIFWLNFIRSSAGIMVLLLISIFVFRFYDIQSDDQSMIKYLPSFERGVGSEIQTKYMNKQFKEIVALRVTNDEEIFYQAMSYYYLGDKKEAVRLLWTIKDENYEDVTLWNLLTIANESGDDMLEKKVIDKVNASDMIINKIKFYEASKK